MRKIVLAILLGCFCAFVNASDDNDSETDEHCDPESEESCEAEEELERGFDPCLINANLPACKPDTEDSDATATERSPSGDEDSDGPG